MKITHYLSAFLLAISICVLPNTVNAQTYTFSTQNGTYTANNSPISLTGPSPLPSTTAMGTFVSIPTPIGFSFVFGGVPYTDFIAYNNGYITLGSVTYPLVNNDLTSTTMSTVIAPLWDLLAPSTSSTSSINYKIIGSVPNRVLSIEWREMSWDYWAKLDVISFQIKLYETTNIIEFIYYQGVSPTDLPSASIGLKLDNGTYYSLNNTGASPFASSTSETSNLSTKPATGQIYRFTPSLPAPPTYPSFAAWYKADANVTSVTSKITSWGSNVGTYDLTQTTTSKQPTLLLGSDNYKLFNYNKRVKFNKVDLTRLANTSTLVTDPLGASGTVFLVLNKTNGTPNGTSFAYDRDGNYMYDPSYQFKAGLRFQTGNNGRGSTYDHYGSGHSQYDSYFTDSVDSDAAFFTSFTGTNTTASIRINSIPASTPSFLDVQLYNPTVATGLSLGSKSVDGENTNDAIAEVILTPNPLTPIQKDMVDSYLSLKYGITRGNNNNTTAEYNYINSSGDVIFDKTTNNSYNNDIAGVGRDDVSKLNQKQSISVNNGEPVSIGLNVIASENATNSNTFASDKSFLIWGNNGAITQSDLNNPITFAQMPAGVTARILRVWKAQTTANFTQTVTVGFESSMLANFNPLSNLVLLVDNDGVNWTNATVYSAALILNNGRVEFPGVTINNTTPYFTLATRIYTATPLPVEMVSNTLTKEACTVKMNWTVASEKDCDYYFIEKSVDGIYWSNIGKVIGSGNSNTTLNYSFTDRNSVDNITYYYRLNQVDYNGEKTTYNPLSISGACLENEIAVFPNPTSNQVTIQIPENSEMKIYDNTSRLISAHSLQKGESEIQISHLAPAVYILRFTMKNGETVIKSLIVK